MKCTICAGELKERAVLDEVREGNNHLLVKIKAEVCLDCGERYYASGVVNRLINIKGELKKRNLKLHEVGKVYEIVST